MKYFTFNNIFLTAVLVISGVFFLANLGNHSLWQDEAQTALISKTILKHWVPIGTDGKNFFSQELGAEYGPNYIWKWHTWLQFYLVAASFVIFGINTFAARLPFALAGVATVVMTFFLSKKLFEDKKAAYFAALLLLFCVPFIILSRQCRYYSLTALFSVCALYFYCGIVNKTKLSAVGFILSCTLLFNSHYIYCAGLFLSVFLHCIVFHRSRIKIIILCLIIIIIVNSPWIMWLSSMKFGQRYKLNFDDFGIAIFVSFIKKLNEYIFPFILFISIPIVWLYVKLFRKNQTVIERKSVAPVILLLLFFSLNLIFLFITSPWDFFRYLTPIVPVFLMLTAAMIAAVWNVNRIAAVLIFLYPIVFGNLHNYIYEITHDYNGPVDGIVKFLKDRAAKDDVVAITYEDLPLVFYTGLKVYSPYTGENLSASLNAKWIILRQYYISKETSDYENYLKQKVNWSNYRKIIIDYPDAPFENREEPRLHNFKTPDHSPVVIYERIK